MSGSREQVARLLALVPYLNAHPEVPLEEASRTFGVSPKQLVSDLKVLWFCGLPGLASAEGMDIDIEALEDGDGRIRLGNADYLSRPARLSSSEASALMLALRALRQSSSAESREVVDRALRKLEAATAEGAAGFVVDPSPDLAETGRVRARLTEALETRRQVRLGYYVPTRDEHTDRVVDPIALLTRDGADYLDAWCQESEGRRLFRLDRVHDLDVLEAPAEEHDVAPRDLGEGFFEPGEASLRATLRLGRVARWVAEYYPVERAVELPDGGLEVVLGVTDPRWLVRLVLRLAPYAEVVEPESLRDQVGEAARRTLAAYAGS